MENVCVVVGSGGDGGVYGWPQLRNISLIGVSNTKILVGLEVDFLDLSHLTPLMIGFFN